MRCFKITMNGFLIIINTVSIAMEQTKPLPIERKLSKSLPVVSQSPDTAPYTLSFAVPTLTTVANGWDSFKNTFTNYVWDDSAFKKLGWPLSDMDAQQELKKTQEVYKRVNDYFQTRVMYEAFLEDRKAISRRYTYCQRVLEALPTIPKRSDALELAMFCLKHHSRAMNDFDKSSFLLFVNVEKEKSTQEVKKADLELAQLTIVPDDNELLKNLFDQTVSVKYPKETVKKIEPTKDVKK